MAGNHVDLLGEHEGKLDRFLGQITITTSHADAFMTSHFDIFRRHKSVTFGLRCLHYVKCFSLVF